MITLYKYSLDAGSKKFICPNCHKKTFVKYNDNETGNYLQDTYGKCDRVNNCNYHKPPPQGNKAHLINYLSLQDISDKAYKLVDVNGMIHIVPKSQVLENNSEGCYISEWFLSKNNINYLDSDFKYFNNNNMTYINTEVQVPKATRKPSFHELQLLEKMFTYEPVEDNLSTYLYSKFSYIEVQKSINSYFLSGTNLSWKNSTVFWQIDEKECLHAGKIMLYNVSYGRRTKEPYNHINWMHKALNTPDFNLSQCLFGLHRINEDYSRTIAITEAEKTAIILNIPFPDFIWLATGSKQNLKMDLLKPVKNRNIILYPDKGEFDNWNNKALEFNKNGYKIAVSDLLENTDLPNGSDLADYII